MPPLIDQPSGQTGHGSHAFLIGDPGIDDSLRLSDNFQLGEFRCRDGSAIVLVHPVLVSLLQTVRDRLQSPLRINSAYRTESYNHQIGGRPRSRHLLGMAADVSSLIYPPSDIADLGEQLGAGGIGVYDSFVHLDVYGRNRRWHG